MCSKGSKFLKKAMIMFDNFCNICKFYQGLYRKFNANRGKSKIKSFIFYCEVQLKLSKFSDNMRNRSFLLRLFNVSVITVMIRGTFNLISDVRLTKDVQHWKSITK